MNVKDRILSSLEDSKAEDIVVIDLAGKSDMADLMIIASGRSDRHVGAIAHHLTQHMKDAGFSQPTVEGLRDCNWVLVETGGIFVHLFRPEVREFYNLEKMWAVELPKSVNEAAFA
ncbi:MAG: rsfS [Rickettsiales bacterium]|jgi:ribosome-associated protein|nr:rsfS [Rickettsiales bacterium]